MSDDFPTEPLRDDEPPTEPLGGADPPTEPLRGDDRPTEPLGRDEPATEPLPGAGSGGGSSDEGRSLGIRVLIGSVLAALVLCGGYIALGGLDYKPAGAADPCDARPWGNPQGLEEIAERFTLSALDGAACDLGVSREELTRALASDDSRKRFAAANGFSDADIEEALRSGLMRAVDDGQTAGAIPPLVATGIRFTIKTLPMSTMIDLIENAGDIFSGANLDDLGGILDGALEMFSPGGTDQSGGSSDGGAGEGNGGGGGTGSGLDGLRDQIEKGLSDRIQKGLNDQIEKGLDQLMNP